MLKYLLMILMLTLLLTGCSAPTGQNTPEAAIIPDAISGTATPEEDPYLTPDWFKSSTMYLVYVRSFADSNGDGIGDLNGVKNHLDYIQSLSVDTIWLMPIYPSPSVHGYDVSDFFAVNAEFGSLEDLRALVEEIHARGMKIILDFVPSHLSNQNPLFVEAYKNPASANSEWFVWTNDEHSLYAGFADLKEMPRFNHYNAQVVDYLTEAALYWLDLDDDGDYTDGVDGFRIDNATFPPQEFFFELRQRIKVVNPEALLLGETWVNSQADLSRFYEGQFDALFDFPLYSLLMGNQNFNGDGLLAGKTSAVLLNSLLKDEGTRYPAEGIAVRFASNHDTNRIQTEANGDAAKIRLAPTLTASLPGAVMIYYGEEIGMWGHKGGPPAWDNYRREPMDWTTAQGGPEQTTWFRPDDRLNQAGDGISVEEQDGVNQSTLEYYRKLFALRRQISALAEGKMEEMPLETDGPGLWAVRRFTPQSQVVVAANFSNETRQATITLPPEFDSAVDLLSGNSFGEITAGQPFSFELPPFSIVWLAPK